MKHPTVHVSKVIHCLTIRNGSRLLDPVTIAFCMSTGYFVLCVCFVCMYMCLCVESVRVCACVCDINCLYVVCGGCTHSKIFDVLHHATSTKQLHS